MRILIVEDEEELARGLEELLVDESYAVDLAVDGASADELMSVNPYDLAILDWSIPAPDGLELLARWRAAGRTLPVLMLTGKAAVADRVGGLDSGADDYLTKPFSIDELLARVRSLLRRRERVLEPELAAGDLRMDEAARRVTVGERSVELSNKEFALLRYLLRRKGELVTQGDLLEHVWDEALDPLSNVVQVTVHRLRRKIDGDRPEVLLHTVKGAGYVLRPERS